MLYHTNARKSAVGSKAKDESYMIRTRRIKMNNFQFNIDNFSYLPFLWRSFIFSM